MKHHSLKRPKKRHSAYKPKTRTLPLNGAKWARLRASVLASSPLCEWCLARGEYVPATDVDHKNNNGDDNRRENLQALCATCHSQKTQAERGEGGSSFSDKKIIFKGCDINGLPLNPDHHWNAPKDHGELTGTNRAPTLTHVSAVEEF